MKMRAQVSLEFLIILAVILTVALVAISLTINFIQSSRDISQGEINAYWATQASPLRIVSMEGYYYSATNGLGEIALLIENIDSKPITVRSFVIEPYSTGTATETSFTVYSAHSTAGSTTGLTALGTAGPSALTGLSVQLAPSQRAAFYLRTQVACTVKEIGRANPDKFYNEFTIYYDTPYFTGLSFKGVKPISGKCNPS